jgi:hypothetical protein
MPAFWIGVGMVAYDGIGHALCFAARMSGQTGANLWNDYSRYIWPMLPAPWFDLYWAAWYCAAVSLLLLGYLTPHVNTPAN